MNNHKNAWRNCLDMSPREFKLLRRGPGDIDDWEIEMFKRLGHTHNGGKRRGPRGARKPRKRWAA